MLKLCTTVCMGMGVLAGKKGGGCTEVYFFYANQNSNYFFLDNINECFFFFKFN